MLQILQGRVHARAVLRIVPGWAPHVDVIGFDGRIPASITLDLRVAFDGIPIMNCS
jgi:hypothetical protein